MNAITIKNLKKSYKSFKALDNINLEIKKGEFFGLLGPNGAGKTTTIGILTGLTNKSSGEVKLFDFDVEQDYKLAREQIGLVPQEFNFDIFEKVEKILKFNAGYYGIKKEQADKRVEYLLKQLGLYEKRKQKALTLSGGMKRKLMIARALLHKPKILILDEPTAGVDVETRQHMWQFLKKINKEGTTILLTTHYLEEAQELCETIAIINQGKIIKIDKKQNLLNILDSQQVEIFTKTHLKTIPQELKKYNPTINKNNLCFNIKKENWQNILKDINQSKLNIQDISINKSKLEDIFIYLTNQSNNK
jgi:ABC-2 type transport system ATP-binding protein